LEACKIEKTGDGTKADQVVGNGVAFIGTKARNRRHSASTQVGWKQHIPRSQKSKAMNERVSLPGENSNTVA